MILTGKTLGKRQYEINKKVIEVTEKNTDFEVIKCQQEKSDIDKILKIDVASKYRHIDFIIDVLKSGDSLYVTRALKNDWIYNDDYSNFINPEYLHENIFPWMSIKMKKKMFSLISMHIGNERAVVFYEYCKKTDMTHFALKFLIKTPDSYKLEFINSTDSISCYINLENLRNFVGLSFTIALAYLDKLVHDGRNVLSEICAISHLYSVSSTKYVDMLEKYVIDVSEYNRQTLGSNLTKAIVTKHKDRVIKKSALYVKFLNMKILVRHSNANDAKLYISSLFPQDCDSFWNLNLWRKYERILNLIPSEDRFAYVKTEYENRYQHSFEMSQRFYDNSYYGYMSVEQQEEWALKNLMEKTETIGEGQEYYWYKFVNLDKALPEMKKYIMVTSDPDKRSSIVMILVASVRNEQQLEKLLNYYYDRHVNENVNIKEKFLDTVLKHHNIFDVEERCWTVFNKILYSIKVYEPLKCEESFYYSFYSDAIRFRIVAILYYISNKKPIPPVLEKFLDSYKGGLHFWNLQTYLKQMNADKSKLVYDYLLKFYEDAIQNFEYKEYSPTLRFYIRFVLDITKYYEIPDSEFPVLVKKYIELDRDYFCIPKEGETQLTSGKVLRLLKQDDATQIIAELPNIKAYFDKTPDPTIFNIALKKLKTYFSHDIAKQVLEYFMQILLKEDINDSERPWIIFSTIFCVFQLADEPLKIELLKKYAPTDPKIAHSTISRKLLYIQEAICNMACYSRPPVPLANIMMYVKGDYVKYSLPMFNLFLANLPLPLAKEFVQHLLNSPVSVQKHGLRGAFVCFDADNLKIILNEAWKKSKNVSLRSVMFTYLYEYIIQLHRNPALQKQLYETLKTFMETIHQDDDDKVLEILTRPRKCPDFIKGDFIETAWGVVSKFENNSANVKRQTSVISFMRDYIEFVPNETLRIVIDEHIHEILAENKLIQPDKKKLLLYEEKWSLVATYIVVNVESEENMGIVSKVLELVLNTCLAMWNEHVHVNESLETFPFRTLLISFIDNIIHYNLDVVLNPRKSYTKINTVLGTISRKIQNVLPSNEIYLLGWTLKMASIVNDIVHDIKLNVSEDLAALIEKASNEKDEPNHVIILARYIANNFGSQVEKLVTDSVKSGKFYLTLVDKIRDIIVTNIRYVQDALPFCIANDVQYTIHIAGYLVNVKSFETVLMGLLISPGRPETPNTHFTELINSIKAFNNEEILCLMFEKFNCSTYYL